MSNRQLIVFAGSALAVGSILHWLYTRSDKRAMKQVARDAALLEMLPLRDYIAATLEDPAMAQTFRRHVGLVRKSWDKLKPHRLEECAHVMYAKLLQEDPSVGVVFDKQLDWASQERIFTIMIGNLVTRLDDPNPQGLVDTLIRLGKRHQELGVSPKQYNSMQRAILSALEQLLGDEWNNDFCEAWATVFGFITHIMIKAAHDPTVSPKGNGSSGNLAAEDKSLGACPMPLVVKNKFMTHVVNDDMVVDTHMHRAHQRPTQKTIAE